MIVTNVSRIPPLRLLFVAVLVSFGASYHFGYQLTLTNPCQKTFLSFLNNSFTLRYDTVLQNHDLEVKFNYLYTKIKQIF